jgi:hypothetical protein
MQDARHTCDKMQGFLNELLDWSSGISDEQKDLLRSHVNSLRNLDTLLLDIQARRIAANLRALANNVESGVFLVDTSPTYFEHAGVRLSVEVDSDK